MYTGTMTLPPWVKDFTKLEFLYVPSGFDVMLVVAQYSCCSTVHRNIQGRTDETSLVSLPDDIFDDMAVLTFIHLAGHPLLQRLPALDGLVNLKSLSLVGLESVAELPSLHALKKIEHLELMALTKLTQISDLSSQTRLAHFVLQNSQVCCNGFIGACDLSVEMCSNGVACVDTSASRSSSKQASRVFKHFNDSICTAPLMSANLNFFSSIKDKVDACGGVMYRQCTSPDLHFGPSSAQSSSSNRTICYNGMMQVIMCSEAPTIVAIRMMQIQRGLGQKCDPVEEQWLGCPST